MTIYIDWLNNMLLTYSTIIWDDYSEHIILEYHDNMVDIPINVMCPLYEGIIDDIIQQ